MVDATEFGESQYLTADVVRNSKNKIAVIVGEPKGETVEFKGEKHNRMTAIVEIDGKKKIWRMNRDTVKNMIEGINKETSNWNGTAVKLSLMSIQGKDSIIGIPQIKKAETQEVI